MSEAEVHIFIPEVTLNIEVTDHCNFRCPMCFQSDTPWVHGPSYPKKFIEISVVRQLISQIKQSGIKMRCVSPFGSGEPLMHPKFLELQGMLLEASARDDLFDNFVYHTNAVFLSRDVVDHLLAYCRQMQQEGRIEKRTFLGFSLDAVTPEVFRAVKGSSGQLYGQVVENIKYLLRRREELQIDMPHLLFLFVIQETNKHQAGEFIRFWSEQLDRHSAKYEITDSAWYYGDRDKLCLARLCSSIECREGAALHERTLAEMGFYATDYAAVLEDRITIPGNQRNPCFPIWHQLFVTSQGMVTVCCRDLELQMAVGDIGIQTFDEILRSEKYHQLRLCHIKSRQETLPLCANCFDPPGGFVNDEEVRQYLMARGLKNELAEYEALVRQKDKAAILSTFRQPQAKYQLKIYDYSPRKDNPELLLRGIKKGSLEIEPKAELEITYRFTESAERLELNYSPNLKDWRGYQAFCIRLKGDGKGGGLEIILQERNGNNWCYFIKDAFQSAGWRLWRLSFDKFMLPEWTDKEDRQMPFGEVIGYKLLFRRDESAVGVEKTVSIGNIWLSNDTGETGLNNGG